MGSLTLVLCISSLSTFMSVRLNLDKYNSYNTAVEFEEV